MPRDASNNFALLFLGALFALPLLFALFAPTAAAQDTSAVTAGAGVYGSANEEAEELRQRAEEFDLKEDAFRLQAENDETEAKRLQARASQLHNAAERLEAQAEQAADEEAEQLETAAKRTESDADELDDKADDLRDSAKKAEKEADEEAEQAALIRQLGDAIVRMAGRWECKYKWDGKTWLEKTEDNAKSNEKDIDVDASERHGMTQERFDILPDYSYYAQEETNAEYVFTREKELGESYEFRIRAARPYSDKNSGKWKIFREKGNVRIALVKEKSLVEIGGLEIIDQVVELDPVFGRNKPVQNWRSAPAAEAEMRSMGEDIAEIFFPTASRFNNPGVFENSFSWWEEHCTKIE